MMRQINLRVSEELLARIEVARGRVPRESWLRWAVEQALSDAKEPIRGEQADPGSVSSSEGVRSSSFAKRDVRPVPKGGA